MKAIIIDDEVNAIKTLEMIFGIFFPQIELIKSFTQSLDAIEFMKNNPFDLLFLDLDMPQFNGIQVLELFKERTFKVFVVSANQVLIKQAKFLNAEGFVSKPPDNNELSDLLTKYFPS